MNYILSSAFSISREVHHFCALLSFGADAICPYMVFESLHLLRQEGLLGGDADSTDDKFFKSFVMAVENGILKVSYSFWGDSLRRRTTCLWSRNTSGSNLPRTATTTTTTAVNTILVLNFATNYGCWLVSRIAILLSARPKSVI